MTNYITVNGKTYWACPECGRIGTCTFGVCMRRLEELGIEFESRSVPFIGGLDWPSVTIPDAINKEIRKSAGLEEDEE